MSPPISPESPFRIAVPDTDISRLHQKLALTVLPSELDDAGWAYGAPLADIQRLVARWEKGGGYDWRKHEAQLNAELPQFTRDIDVEGFGTLNTHYVHKKSDVADAVPLLFVHGWPGSFIEVRKILPFLVKASSDHPSFHVVAFSLPGYGFSTAPSKKGFDIPQYAELGHKLMLALGYNEYVTQGGDWGAMITCNLAKTYGGKHCKAYHTNYPRSDPPQFTSEPLRYLSDLLSSYTPFEKAGLARTHWFRTHGRGYFHEQSTQPQTLGYGLSDSPVGLLAWIYEKLINWTDEYKWDDDEVLTWVSIYWFSRAGPAASLRIYYEAVHAQRTSYEVDLKGPDTVPVGHSYFPRELVVLPRKWLQGPTFVFESEHQSGGHFASYEKPAELSGDLRKMFGKGGPAFGVVPGKTGYASK